MKDVEVRYVHASSKDNVAMALTDLEEEETITLKGKKALQLEEPIPYMHKFAVEEIPEGEPVIKLGHVIGVAASRIEAGQHVHIHNIKGVRADQQKYA